jgi:hypothetical protein
MAIKHHGRAGQFRLTSVEAAQTAMAIVPGAGRPSPPADLTSEEAELWNMYVKAMPDNWFTRETQPILKELCFHASNSQHVHEEVVRLRQGAGNIKELAKVLKIAAIETKFVLNLSDKLRLTHKSKWSQPQAAAKQHLASKARPWEIAK